MFSACFLACSRVADDDVVELGDEGESADDGFLTESGSEDDGSDSSAGDELEPVRGAFIWIYDNDQREQGLSAADRVWLAGVDSAGRSHEPQLVAERRPDAHTLRASHPLRGRSEVFGSEGAQGMLSLRWYHHAVDGHVVVDDELPKSWKGEEVRPTKAAGGQRHAFIIRALDGEKSEAFVWDAPLGQRSSAGPRTVLAHEEGFELRTSVLSDDGSPFRVYVTRRTPSTSFSSMSSNTSLRLERLR